ncbi:MAG: hypothetical protein JWR18_3793 [Segetibacter sp.]|nr:hypothetical protein [Segetibacter sp.]
MMHSTFAGMVLIRILFYFIVFYSLFKLLIRVVLPFVIKRTLQSKMKDIRQNMGEFENGGKSTQPQPDSFTKKETSTAAKGDYIDFEEVK